MKKQPTEPVRGQAAYRAHLKEITRNNEAAQAAAVNRRAAKEAQAVGEAADRARREMSVLRRQKHD